MGVACGGVCACYALVDVIRNQCNDTPHDNGTNPAARTSAAKKVQALIINLNNRAGVV